MAPPGLGEQGAAALAIGEEDSWQMISDAFTVSQPQPEIPVLITYESGRLVIAARGLPGVARDQLAIDEGVLIQQEVEDVIMQAFHVREVAEDAVIGIDERGFRVGLERLHALREEAGRKFIVSVQWQDV